MMFSGKLMSLESDDIKQFSNQELVKELAVQVENLSSELKNTVEIRELDKRYTYANPKQGKCTMESCSNNATHWLTRQSADYCQSDMVCNQHAMIWMQVRDLISQSSSI